MVQTQHTNPMAEVLDGHKFITISGVRLGSPEYLFYNSDDNYEMTWKEGMEEIEDFNWQLNDEGPQEGKAQQSEPMEPSKESCTSGAWDQMHSTHRDAPICQRMAIKAQTGVFLSPQPERHSIEMKSVKTQSADYKPMSVLDPEIVSGVPVSEPKTLANSNLDHNIFAQYQTESLHDVKSPLIWLERADESNKVIDVGQIRGGSLEISRSKRYQGTTSDKLSSTVAAREASLEALRNSTFSSSIITSTEPGMSSSTPQPNLLASAEEYSASTNLFSQGHFRDGIRLSPRVPSYNPITLAASKTFNEDINSKSLSSQGPINLEADVPRSVFGGINSKHSQTDQNPQLAPMLGSPMNSPRQISLDKVKYHTNCDRPASTEGHQLKKHIFHLDKAIQTPAVTRPQSLTSPEIPRLISSLRATSSGPLNIASASLIDETGTPPTYASSPHWRMFNEDVQEDHGSFIVETPTTESDRTKEDVDLDMPKRNLISHFNEIAYAGSEANEPPQNIGPILSKIPGFGFFGLGIPTEDTGILNTVSASRTPHGSVKVRKFNQTRYSPQREPIDLGKVASASRSIEVTMNEINTKARGLEELRNVLQENPVFSTPPASNFTVKGGFNPVDYSLNTNAELQAMIEERNMPKRYEGKNNMIKRLRMWDGYGISPETSSPTKSAPKNRRSALQSMVKERGLSLREKESSYRLAKRIEAHDRKTRASTPDNENSNASTTVSYTPHPNKPAQTLLNTPGNIPGASILSSPAFIPMTYGPETRAQLRQLLVDHKLDPGSLKDNKSKLQRKLQENDVEFAANHDNLDTPQIDVLIKQRETKVHLKGSKLERIQFLKELDSRRISAAFTTPTKSIEKASIDAGTPGIQLEENKIVTKKPLELTTQVANDSVKLPSAGDFPRSKNLMAVLENRSTAHPYANGDEPGANKTAHSSSRYSSPLSELSDRDFGSLYLAGTQAIQTQMSHASQTPVAPPSRAIRKARLDYKVKHKAIKRSRPKTKNKDFKLGEDSSSSEGVSRRKKRRTGITGKTKPHPSSTTGRSMISDHFSSNKSNDGQVGHMTELVHSGAVDRLDSSSGADTFEVQAGEHRSPGEPSGSR